MCGSGVGRAVHVSATVLTVTDAPSAAASAVIEAGLNGFNRVQAGHWDSRPLGVLVSDAEGGQGAALEQLPGARGIDEDAIPLSKMKLGWSQLLIKDTEIGFLHSWVRRQCRGRAGKRNSAAIEDEPHRGHVQGGGHVLLDEQYANADCRHLSECRGKLLHDAWSKAE
jgi:hypothetical protein